MLVGQKIWRSFPGAGYDDGHPLDKQLPSEKITVRLRSAVAPEGLPGGEKLGVWKGSRGQMVKMEVGAGDGGKQQDLVEYRVDRVLGPSARDTEVYEAAAAHLVDRAIRGGNGLLLLTGTARSESAHSVRKLLAPPRAPDGLVPSALADLIRQWRGETERCYRFRQPPEGLEEPEPATVATGDSNFVVRLCVVEILGGIDCQTRDLLRGINDATTVATGGGGEGQEFVSPAPVRSLSVRANEALAMIVSSGRRPPEGSSGGGTNDGLRLPSVGRGPRGGKAGRDVAAGMARLASSVLLGMTEATASGLDEALALIKKGRSRCSEDGHGHFVVAMKLITKDDEPAATEAAKGIRTTCRGTGELVFVEMSDCPGGDLPKILLTLLELLKRSNQVATSAYKPPESSAGATAEQIAPWATLHDSDSGRSSDNSLRTLLESLAGSVTALRGFPAQETAAATVALSWKFGGRQRSSTSLNSVRGAAFSSESQADATKDVLLAVSVVATLDVGGAFREENAALLEVLARSSRKRQTSWRSFKRMMKSIHSLARRSSQVKREAAASTFAVRKNSPSVSSSEDSRGLSSAPVSTLTVEAAPDQVENKPQPTGGADRPFNDAASAVKTASSPVSPSFARAAASAGYLIEAATKEQRYRFSDEEKVGRGPSVATEVSPSRKSPTVPVEPTGQASQEWRKTPFITSDPTRGTETEPYSRGGLEEQTAATTLSIARSEEADHSDAAGVSSACRVNPHTDRSVTKSRSSAERERPSDGGFELGERGASVGTGGEASTNPRQDSEEGEIEEQVEEERHHQDPIRQLLLLPMEELAKRVLQAEKSSSYWKTQHALAEKKLAELRAQLWPTKIGTIIGEAIPSPRAARVRRDAKVHKLPGVSDADKPAGERHTRCDENYRDTDQSFPSKAFLRGSGGMIPGEGGSGTAPVYPRAHAFFGGVEERARGMAISPSRLTFVERRALFCPEEKQTLTAMGLDSLPVVKENGVAKEAAPAFTEHPLGGAVDRSPRASEAPLVVEEAEPDARKRRSLRYRAIDSFRPKMIERANGQRFTFHGEDPAGDDTRHVHKASASSGSQTLLDSSTGPSYEEPAHSGQASVSESASHLAPSAPNQASPRTLRGNASSTNVTHPRAAISASPEPATHTGRRHTSLNLPSVVLPHIIPGGSSVYTQDVDSPCSSVFSPQIVSPPSFSRPRAEGRADDDDADDLHWAEESESSSASCRPTWNAWDGIWEGQDSSPAGWWRQSAPAAGHSRSPDEGAGGGRSRAWPVGSDWVTRDDLASPMQTPPKPRFPPVGFQSLPTAISRVASSSASASPATVLENIKSRLLSAASQLPDDIMSPDEAAAAEAAAGALKATAALMSAVKTRDSTTTFLSRNVPGQVSWGRPSATAYGSRDKGWDGSAKSFALSPHFNSLPTTLPPRPAPLPQGPEKRREAEMMQVC